MSESEEREFIREKIIDKAGGRRYRTRKLLGLLAAAVIFGLVSSLFFMLGKKYLEPRFFSEETVPTQKINIGKDTEEESTSGKAAASLEGETETDPEGTEASGTGQTQEADASGEGLTEEDPEGTGQAGNPGEGAGADQTGNAEPTGGAGHGSGSGQEGSSGQGSGSGQEGDTGQGSGPGQTEPPEGTGASSESGGDEASPQELLAQQIAEAASLAVSEELKLMEDYLALAEYRNLSRVMKQINKGLVTISSMTWDRDWFDNPVSSADQSAGAIIYTTDAEVLILADYASVSEAEALNVTFSNGKPVEARLKKADSITGIAVISVSQGAIPDEIKDGIVPLTLGNSYQLVTGTPIIAAGSPAGYTGSVTNGIISCIQRNTTGTDTAFQLLYPNAHVAEGGGGFLFNTDGELIGVLSGLYGDKETGLPAAIGVSSLKGIVKALSSGIDAAYLGVQGQNATTDIAEANEMPVGIYVTRVIVDSPAHEAGLKAGDIIVASGESDLTTTQKLQSFLENYSTGDVVVIRAYRSGQDEYVDMEFEVTLGAR